MFASSTTPAMEHDMKPLDHTAEFADATRVFAKPDEQRLERRWVKVNGKLECRYEMKSAQK
ncbi:MAG: hypothetical protein NW206_20530 [Hyphomonadaceae bacterium]|nr:hypothetical protein [Hyphomonadaceae bacterium]